MQAMMHRENPQELARAVCSYLVSIPENRGKDVAAFAPELAGHLEEQVQENGGTSAVDKLLGTMRYIKQNEYRFPLKMSLLIKNMFGLERFARDAGFSGGMMEALSYQPI